MKACARAAAAFLVSVPLASCYAHFGISTRETYTVGDHITVDANNNAGTITGARSYEEALAVANAHCARPWSAKGAGATVEPGSSHGAFFHCGDPGY